MTADKNTQKCHPKTRQFYMIQCNQIKGLPNNQVNSFQFSFCSVGLETLGQEILQHLCIFQQAELLFSACVLTKSSLVYD